MKDVFNSVPERGKCIRNEVERERERKGITSKKCIKPNVGNAEIERGRESKLERTGRTKVKGKGTWHSMMCHGVRRRRKNGCNKIQKKGNASLCHTNQSPQVAGKRHSFTLTRVAWCTTSPVRFNCAGGNFPLRESERKVGRMRWKGE